MNANIPVTCLLDRSWNPLTREYEGAEYDGELIDIAMETSAEDSGKLISVGIVVLEDGAFHSVPVQHIKKII